MNVKGRKKHLILGGLCTIGILSVIVFSPSKAKYKITENIPLASGTINYKLADMNIIAMYQEENGTYKETSTMPGSEYTINESKSYCNVNGSKDTNAVLKTIDGNHTIANLQKGSKCFLYFDEPKKITITVAGDNGCAMSPTEYSIDKGATWNTIEIRKPLTVQVGSMIRITEGGLGSLHFCDTTTCDYSSALGYANNSTTYTITGTEVSYYVSGSKYC